MSRILEALKTLETRRPLAVPFPPLDEPLAADEPLGFSTLGEPAAPEFHVQVEPLAVSPSMFEMCSLPAASEISDHYLELSQRISDECAASYCNVLLFVSAQHGGQDGFSMTHLAQAFALQSNGNVLLVDGDLRDGRLSKSVGAHGPGFIEAMSGTVAWPQIIHPTSTPRVDFVPRGRAEVPTFERPDFGWSALRPKYRAVLIGVGMAGEPETHWLAARCDAVYLVISRPHTTRHAASAAVTGLKASGANVLGCVLANS